MTIRGRLTLRSCGVRQDRRPQSPSSAIGTGSEVMARPKKSIRRVMAGLVTSGTANTVVFAAELPALAVSPSADGGVGVFACSSFPSVADPNVLKTVYEVGLGLNVTSRVMLAGFEAGWVESRMNNLPCGDRDSLGV